jgi:tRNA A-37 threonylcarbamoyl transferase component Bud32
MSDPAEPIDAGSPAEERPDELIGRVRQVVGQEFEIVGVLGRGGMATVYLAFERALARMVALKVLHPLVLSSHTMRERFVREAKLAAALGHRNVVAIHGLREGQGIIVLVLRAVMGRSLAAILAEEGALPLPLVQRIVAQVAGALAYSHRHGVIHRDIKPGNILLDEEGTVHVSDFGIAKALEDPNLTSTGSAIGTPAYMSPEQCDGGLVTGAADQYGLGAVAYEMLTGRTPFGADTAMGLMYAQTHHTPMPLGEVRPDIPPSLATAVERMLMKDPAARWATLDEMVRHVGKPVIEGLDDPFADELGRLARRGSPALQLASSYQPSPAPARLSDPEAATVLIEGRRGGRWRWLAAAGIVLVGGALLLPGAFGGNATPPPAAGTAPRPPSTAESTGRPPASQGARRPAPVVDPRRDTAAARRAIQQTVLRYTRAVESRNIADVIAAVPSLTPEEQRGWEHLFTMAPTLRFDVSVGRIAWEERGAEAELRGFLAYTPRGETRREVDGWNRRAELALGPNGWRIIRFK